jgi:hypothetical protein
MPLVNQFKADLAELKESYTNGVYGPVQHWKIDFPVLEFNPEDD